MGAGRHRVCGHLLALCGRHQRAVPCAAKGSRAVPDPGRPRSDQRVRAGGHPAGGLCRARLAAQHRAGHPAAGDPIRQLPFDRQTGVDGVRRDRADAGSGRSAVRIVSASVRNDADRAEQG